MNTEKIRIGLLKVLVFCIPYQHWEPFNSPYTNVTFLAYFAYILFALTEGQKLFRIRDFGFLLVPLVALCGIMLYMTRQNYYPDSVTAYSEVRQMIMQMIFFWLLINEIRLRPHLQNTLLQVFVYSIALMGFAFLVGIGVEYKSGRLKIFEANSNAIGLWFVLAIFIIVKFLFEKIATGIKRYIFFFCIPLFVLVIALTGSRGSIILFFIGSLVYLLSVKMTPGRKMPIIMVGMVVMAIAYAFISQVDIVQSRFTDDEDTLGGRLEIWELAWPLFERNPWFGVGASGYESYMSQFYTRVHAPHNVYLMVLLYAGIMGLLAFITFLFFVARKMLANNKHLNSPFYNVVYFIYIAIFFKAGGFLTSFTLWFFLAMMVGGGLVARQVKHYYLARMKQIMALQKQ